MLNFSISTQSSQATNELCILISIVHMLSRPLELCCLQLMQCKCPRVLSGPFWGPPIMCEGTEDCIRSYPWWALQDVKAAQFSITTLYFICHTDVLMADLPKHIAPCQLWSSAGSASMPHAASSYLEGACTEP